MLVVVVVVVELQAPRPESPSLQATRQGMVSWREQTKN
jgi:hypothetical protein